MADPQSNAALPAHQLPEPPTPPVPLALPPDAPRAGVLHVRHRHTERYTVVGNHLARHPRLSAAAIGVGVYIQSLPDGASVTIKALTLRFLEGEVTISRALRELEREGYLVRRRVPLGGGRIATRTVFHECPGGSDTLSGSVPARVPRPESSRPVHVPQADTARTPSERRIFPPPTPDAPRAPDPPDAVSAALAEPAPGGPAADLLAGLRLVDSRLLLSERDVRRLVPSVEDWFARSATAAQIVRTLTAGLPPASTPVHHPGRLLEHRLGALLPPPLPVRTATPPEGPPVGRPAPMTNCDGCDRGFRSHDPRARCADCRADRLRSAA
ncbi:hypothetical protein QFZ75_003356 [Streptomyces sp. V3I8]|uniref:hypothetical protein n=1 Tax=Streptomyces sp. V3I8 TaxID=3042279 RepID=UPI00278502C6|nr:hypothetical protein [Streptomyces sp. V3I8]MDQ1036940.1 hypothetical protein [Streptomyces sp. V3I8]